MNNINEVRKKLNFFRMFFFPYRAESDYGKRENNNNTTNQRYKSKIYSGHFYSSLLYNETPITKQMPKKTTPIETTKKLVFCGVKIGVRTLIARISFAMSNSVLPRIARCFLSSSILDMLYNKTKSVKTAANVKGEIFNAKM